MSYFSRYSAELEEAQQVTGLQVLQAPIAVWYEIDYSNMRIRNQSSHGWKDIVTYEASSDWDYPHLAYINDDGRLWYQAITWAQLDVIDRVKTTDVGSTVIEEEPFGYGDYL